MIIELLAEKIDTKLLGNKHLYIDLLGSQIKIIEMEGDILMAVENQDFEMYQGDVLTLRYTVTLEEKDSLDGLTALWSVLVSGVPVLTKTIIILEDTIVEVELVAIDTQSLLGRYTYELIIQDVSTIATGIITVLKSYK